MQLIVRVFDGTQDITGSARVNIFGAGDRQTPLGPPIILDGGWTLPVAPGLYDVQVLRSSNGQITGLKWAERLLVIQYPDEPGVHLQVVNLKPGFGALQIRVAGTGAPPEPFTATAHPPGEPNTVAGEAVRIADYLLLVLPAGNYDVRVRQGAESSWLADVEVPLDRTRLKQVAP